MEFITPRKKRARIEDDDAVVTPKKLRTAPLTPPRSTSAKPTAARPLPDHLTRLLQLHAAIEQALSLSLATASVGVSPAKKSASDNKPVGYMTNVVNHLSLQGIGLARQCTPEDLSRLLWLWEWDGETLPSSSPSKPTVDHDSDNPFLVESTDWTREGTGLVVTATTNYTRSTGKRTPAYGIGIRVDVAGKRADMGAVAKWMSGGPARRRLVAERLSAWYNLNNQEQSRKRQKTSQTTSRTLSSTLRTIPEVPFSDLPSLPSTTISGKTPSSLTRTLATSPLKSSPLSTPTTNRVLRTPMRYQTTPSTPASTSSSRSSASPIVKFGQPIPFSIPGSTSKLSSISEDEDGENPFLRASTPDTPRASASAIFQQALKTPQSSVPSTPSSSSRRAALFERVRQKSMNTPSKGMMTVATKIDATTGEKTFKDLTAAEIRRRSLLGRLPTIAEAVWMLFAAPPATPSSTPTPATRRRRTIPLSEVVTIILQSSRTPISSSEALESIRLLTTLCPDFLKSIVLQKGKNDEEEWLQMASGGVASGSTKAGGIAGALPGSPTKKVEVEEKMRKRLAGPPPSPSSPNRISAVRTGGVTLRDVKERIRRELEESS